MRLDLAADRRTFGSVTTIRFPQRGRADVRGPQTGLGPQHLPRRAPVDPDLLDRGRLPIDTDRGAPRAGRGRRDAVPATTARGLHRSVDPADGRHYVYGMNFMDAAPTVYACFDQPDLKAPYTFHVTAPTDWIVIGNAPGTNPSPVVWGSSPPSRSRRTSSPWSPGLPRAPRRGTTASRSACPRAPAWRGPRRGRRRALHDDPAVLRRVPPALRHRYPFGAYHQAFVPGSTPARWRTRAA